MQTPVRSVLMVAALLIAPGMAVAAPPDRETALARFNAVRDAEAVGAGWTGSVEGCAIGTESAASQAATLQALNTLRDFAGLGPVTLDEGFNRDALAAALMMRAAGRLSHSPGPDWPCYSEEGARGAGSSNLFLGSSGAAAMVGYVDDSGVSSLGHRRWLLNPGATTFGTGSTGTTNALYVFGASQPVAAGTVVAWPPAGAVPWEWIFDDWSVAVGNRDQQVDLGSARVSVALDGTPLQVGGVAELGGGYGSGATLRWGVAFPADARSADHRLDVTVDGVVVDGAPFPVAYSIGAFRAVPPRRTDDRGSQATGRPQFLRRPRIGRADGLRGAPRPGTRLRSEVAVRGAATIRYRWLRSGKAIRGATASSYRVKRADRGRRLALEVTARSRTGVAVARSSYIKVARR